MGLSAAGLLGRAEYPPPALQISSSQPLNLLYFSAYSLLLQAFGFVTFPMTETGPFSLVLAFSNPTTQTWSLAMQSNVQLCQWELFLPAELARILAIIRPRVATLAARTR